MCCCVPVLCGGERKAEGVNEGSKVRQLIELLCVTAVSFGLLCVAERYRYCCCFDVVCCCVCCAV